MSTVFANGVSIAYDSFGTSGDAAILLISGLGTQRLRWTAPFCTGLAAKGYHVLRFDNRDCGEGAAFTAHPAPDFGTLAQALMAGQRPDVPYDLNDMARDALGLMDALGISRAHVVGRSMGGMIAQIMASEHPTRLRSLTSIMSSSGNPSLPPAEPDVMALMTGPTRNKTGYVAHALRLARRLAGSGTPFDETAQRALIEADLRVGLVPGGTARQIAAMAAMGDRRPRLARITVPTLVIHGTEDPVFPLACGADTADSIPGARFMPIPGMGHELPPSRYAEITQAIDILARTAA